jgi:2-methylisocitrate lyase-like PEP mutase family enzyme
VDYSKNRNGRLTRTHAQPGFDRAMIRVTFAPLTEGRMSEFIDEARRKRLALRALLAGQELVVMPGGFSPVYARMAQEIGFPCFFLAGSQMSGFLLGVPDTGILGLRDVVDHARHAAACTSIPLLLDADTGFGNAVNVHYSVQEIVRSGVAALNIEDQEAPKKSPTGGGRRCIPRDEAVGKIRAAVAARDAVDPSFVLCARCDSIGVEPDIEATIARCRAYAEAGADLVWLNAVEKRDQLARVCAATPAPVLCNWFSNVEPLPSHDEFTKLGVRVALYPVMAAQAGLQGAWELMCDFKARGPAALADWRQRSAKSPFGLADYKALTGHADVRTIEERFLPAGDQRDYRSR